MSCIERSADMALLKEGGPHSASPLLTFPSLEEGTPQLLLALLFALNARMHTLIVPPLAWCPYPTFE